MLGLAYMERHLFKRAYDSFCEAMKSQRSVYDFDDSLLQIDPLYAPEQLNIANAAFNLGRF